MATSELALVTGGGGFIGSHLIDRLLTEGYSVRVLDNFATGSRENLAHVAGDVDLVEGDIQSYERAHNAVKGADLVFHQAALPSVPRSIQDPLTSTNVNVTGTLNILLAARDEGVRRVVYASSSSVYGSNPALPKTEDMATLPRAPYAVAKLAGEGYCRSFFEVYGLDTVALRYFNVFGPRQDPASQYAAVIPHFIDSLLQGQPPNVFGDGEQPRDFTYVADTVEANVCAARAGKEVAGQAFNIAGGARVSLNVVLEQLGSMIEDAVPPNYHETRPGDIRHSQADIARAREQLSFNPSVSVRDGLALTLEYFRERGPG